MYTHGRLTFETAKLNTAPFVVVQSEGVRLVSRVKDFNSSNRRRFSLCCQRSTERDGYTVVLPRFLEMVKRINGFTVSSTSHGHLAKVLLPITFAEYICHFHLFIFELYNLFFPLLFCSILFFFCSVVLVNCEEIVLYFIFSYFCWTSNSITP